MSALPEPPAVSPAEVARAVDRFVESILITIEERMDEALSDEGLSFSGNQTH